MDTVVIVHLSDIHFSGSDKDAEIIQKLKADLEGMKQKVGDYHIIALTGDCIDKGKVELFQNFGAKMDEIRCTCHVSKKRVTSVPGNHDASRQNRWLNGIKMTYSDTDKILNEVQSDISPLFPEYNKFVEMFSGIRDGIGVTHFTVNNICVRIILLNSSWSTLINNEYGQLRIGNTQLSTIRSKVKKYRGKKPDITIACLHHPFDWFAYDDRIKLQQLLYDQCGVDILLHGHIHEADYASTSNIDLATRTFCTGISYNKTGENSSRKDGMRYSIYEINLLTKTINVYLRSTNSKLVFVDDNTLYSKVTQGGFFTVPFGNTFDCTMSLNEDKSDIHRIFLEREFVKLLLEEEKLLFQFYWGVTKFLEQEILPEADIEFERLENNWKKEHNTSCLNEAGEKEVKLKLYQYQFGLYCMGIINILHALLFKEQHSQARILVRVFNKSINQHVARYAEGIHSGMKEIKESKNFLWGEGMIYHSYQTKRALLKSANLSYHARGNKDIWLDYLTAAVSEITIEKGKEKVPLLALNIAITDKKDAQILYALAKSSLYDVIQEVFLFFEDKVTDIDTLFDSA